MDNDFVCNAECEEIIVAELKTALHAMNRLLQRAFDKKIYPDWRLDATSFPLKITGGKISKVIG